MLGMVLGAIAIGVTLGLLGSGGSILTVPVLVYGLGHPDKSAIAESLAIVGAISAAGAIPFIRAGNIDWRNVWFFGIPGMVGTYGGAALAAFVPGPVQLVLFAVVMVLAAILMFRSARGIGVHADSFPPRGVERDLDVGASSSANASPAAAAASHRHPLWKIVVEGVLVGVLTGLVGVGGGFLIVPALVLLGGLSMRLAVGTSLIVIAMKSFSGFFKYLHVLRDLDVPVAWTTVAIFIGVGIGGTLVGGALNRRISQPLLQRVFAIFLVVMGAYVLYREIPRALHLQP